MHTQAWYVGFYAAVVWAFGHTFALAFVAYPLMEQASSRDLARPRPTSSDLARPRPTSPDLA